MTNKEILDKRWKPIDKEIEKFTKNFKYDVKTRINAFLKMFSINNDNLYDYMKTQELSIFKSELQDIQEDVSDYLKYKINQYLKRTKIKNYEALQILIEIAYFKSFQKAQKFEDELFNATATITSEMIQRESYDLRLHLKKFHLIPLPNYLLPHLMSLPLYLGYDWLTYKQSMIQYNSNKMYRNIVIDIQQKRLDLDRYNRTFEIERKRYLTALDNEVASLSSYVALWGMEKQGIKKVQFIAVMDEKTTKICQSMNEQIFDIKEKNVYYRYANNNDDRTTKYETIGLQIGENQPSLHYNCRSVLIPYK